MSYELKLSRQDLDYTADLQKITSFILFYPENVPKYLKKTSTINISLTDIFYYDETLYTNILKNTLTYKDLFYQAYDSIFYDDKEVINDENVVMYHRLMKIKEKMPDKKITDIFPVELLRDYEVHFVLENIQSDLFVGLRLLQSNCVGKYVLTRGLVTKITQIKPILKLAAYICEVCGCETFQTVDKSFYNMLLSCSSEKCKMLKIRPTLILKHRASRFVSFQIVTISESVQDMGIGTIPRSVKLHVYGELCGLVRPGDFVYASGVLKGEKRWELTYDTFLVVDDFYTEKGSVRRVEQKVEHTVDEPALNVELQGMGYNLHDIPLMRNMTLEYVNTLVDYFAPEIYGHTSIKKLLLLSLVGSITKQKNYMKIRNTINVLLVGDPGIAKSQLLKTVQKIAPRGVFTTGKGSSGVGLTASVTKDHLTKEMVLEGGALVLSDQGTCCIDELDKMTETDRVSIHEVMEQQSISINKAGINTSLNARCSIIGAANPTHGSYKEDRSLEWNVGLPVALLSRFDCVVVIKDLADEEKDRRLAEHVTKHFTIMQDEEEEVCSYDFLRAYIANSQKISPTLSKSQGAQLINKYVERRKDKSTTPRYLLSLIRFAIAHAKLRLSNLVEDVDIEESLRLMEETNLEVKGYTVSKDKAIYEIIMANLSNNEVEYEVVKNLCGQYTKDDVDSVINSYVDLGIMYVDGGKIKILG